ncbi:MAG: D-alanyl-D-alanine carboxypeptidase, partial [Patescibacteria group bacterium]|nr:D-alanyl-D-alanine carboxypeptidase [Patescibacteria group bacterium]
LIALFSLLVLRAAPAVVSSTQPAIAWNQLPVAKYVSAPALSSEPKPTKKDAESFGVSVSARGAIVMDEASGDILFEKGARDPYPIASLTKLMTAMVFLDQHPNLDEEVAMDPSDSTTEGRSVFMPSERLTKREILRAALVESVNAAANALARLTGMTREDFLKAMNEKAKALGMQEANFADPVGLDPRSSASAHDVALALRAALSYPEIREAASMDKVKIKGLSTGHMYEITTTNLLLTSFLNKAPYKIIAAKTGSLPEAGFCLAQVTEREPGEDVIAVVLGSDNHFDRFQDVKAMTTWAFDTFEWPQQKAERDQSLVMK